MSSNSNSSFLITIDTEGDNLWGRPSKLTTRNSKFIPRFQELCERYSFKPTYVTNYEMAKCPDFKVFALDVLKKNNAEIGMHLHAWDSPPIIPLTSDDNKYHPYLIEYDAAVMEKKIDFLTKLLEDTFEKKMVSHRAGRWSFNEVYAKLLVKYGYKVDCSVSPLVSWKGTLGDPKQKGGTDYSDFPDSAYFLNLNNIKEVGNSELLEVPVSIVKNDFYTLANLSYLKKGSFFSRALNKLLKPIIWLRPNGQNIHSMKKIIDRAVEEKRDYVEFMIHSSEFMPGGSPYFQTEAALNKLYEDIEELFDYSYHKFSGRTLSEFYLLKTENKHVSVI